MSKKTAFIIIIVLVILIAGGFLAFYFYSNRGQGNDIIPIDNNGNIFPNSPNGTGTPFEQPDGNETTPITDNPSSGGLPLLLKELSMRPSAGAVAIATSSGILVRFMEKGTGNVYEVSPDNSAETRLSNTTLPRITEALWNKNGDRLIARYEKDGEPDNIQSYYAKLTASGTGQPEGSLDGSFLTENISEMATNRDQTKIFYTISHSIGSSGTVSEFDGTKKSQIFDSPLSEWQIDWPTPSLIAMTTKPAGGVPGFLYFLNSSTGTFTRAIAGVNGLTALVSPDGSFVLYSESISGGLSLKIYSFQNGDSETVAVTTLPEKCVWSKNNQEIVYCSVPSYLPEGNYPDVWYKGLVSFSDDIWEIDTLTGAGKLLARLEQLGRKEIDGTNLFLDSKENYLFLTNKNDSHLWSLKIAN